MTTNVVSSSRIDVTWQPSTDNVGVTGYRVMRNGSLVATVAATSHSSTGLAASTQYSFTVQAVDAAGNQSAVSAAATASTPAGQGNVITANPTNYPSIVSNLKPGDTLVLEPGTYNAGSMPGLRLHNLNGTASAPITIMGDPTKARPVIQGNSGVNTVRLANTSYLVLRHLEIDSRGMDVDGIKGEGTTHHITLEDLVVKGNHSDQAIVGISTNGGTAWNWIIRRCVIDGAGTGMYLGNSDGNMPFINGLIENNLVINSIGYNIQIKHQNPYTLQAGMPAGPNTTIIRNNVFSKSGNSETNPLGVRPNLLVGAFPNSGPGSNDKYEIYRNFFYQNPTEALFQGEGNIAFHHNLMVTNGDAVNIQQHNGQVRTVRIFNNTIIAGDTGIRISGGASGFTQSAIGNAVFAATPLSLSGPATQSNNTTGTVASAGTFLVNPTGALGALDLFPRTGQLQGTFDSATFNTYTDWDRDFNGAPHPNTIRGAYGLAGTNPGWKPKLEIRP